MTHLFPWNEFDKASFWIKKLILLCLLFKIELDAILYAYMYILYLY